MNRVACGVAAIVMTGSGCSGRVPSAPTSTLQAPEAAAKFATLSGWVYARAPGDPALAAALVTVTEAGGSEHAALTNAGGFYELTVPAGTIAITASKEGYEAKTWEFSLLKDTVLNFGLTPK